MPKAFNPDERRQVDAALRAAALQHFSARGIRQARVEDICRDVGIAKGSFYAFYPSKEELFMAIVADRETQHMTDMYAYLTAAGGTVRRRARGFFDLILKKIESDPALNIVLAHGEIAHLVLKLGRERFNDGAKRDRTFAAKASRLWQDASGVDVRPADLLALMTITLSIVSQRGQLTAQQYEPAVTTMRDLFVARLLGEA